MEEPEFTQHPTEIFGYAFVDATSEAQTAREDQFCPFLNDECKKPRKSQPEVKVGVCTVGYKGNFLEKMTPIIVCPHRLREKTVYRTIEGLYFGSLPDEYSELRLRLSFLYSSRLLFLYPIRRFLSSQFFIWRLSHRTLS